MANLDNTNPSQPIEKEDREAVPHIVEAVFTSANTGGIDLGLGKSPLAKMIEGAMAQAVEYCYSNGINDPEKVREMMQVARAQIKAMYNKAVAEAMSNLQR